MLSRIPDEDIQYLLMNPAHSHPKDMVLTRIPVPPIASSRRSPNRREKSEESPSFPLRRQVNWLVE